MDRRGINDSPGGGEAPIDEILADNARQGKNDDARTNSINNTDTSTFIRGPLRIPGVFTKSLQQTQTAGSSEAAVAQQQQQQPAIANEAASPASPASASSTASLQPSPGNNNAAHRAAASSRKSSSPLALRLLAMKQQRSASATRQGRGQRVGVVAQQSTVEDDSVVAKSRSSKHSTVRAAAAVSADVNQTASSLYSTKSQRSKQHYGSTTLPCFSQEENLAAAAAAANDDDDDGGGGGGGRSKSPVAHVRSTEFSPLRNKTANNASKHEHHQQRSTALPFSLAAAHQTRASSSSSSTTTSSSSPPLRAAGDKRTTTTIAVAAAVSRTLIKSVKQQSSTTTTTTSPLAVGVGVAVQASSSSSSVSSPPKDHPRSTSSTRRRFMATRQRFQHQEQQPQPQGVVKNTPSSFSSSPEKKTLSKEGDILTTRKTKPTGRAPATVTTTVEDTTRTAVAVAASARPVVVVVERRSEKVKRRQRSLSTTRSVVSSNNNSSSSSSIQSMDDSRQEKQCRSESVPRASGRPRGQEQQEEQQSSTEAAASSSSPLRATHMAVILLGGGGGGSSTLRNNNNTKSRTDLMRRARAQSKERARSRSRQRNDAGSESESDSSSMSIGGGNLLKQMYSNDDSDSSLGKNILSKLDDVEKKLMSKLACSSSSTSNTSKLSLQRKITIRNITAPPREEDHPHARSMSAATTAKSSSPSASLLIPSSTASLDKKSSININSTTTTTTNSHSTRSTVVDDDNVLADSPLSPPEIRSTMSSATATSAAATAPLPSLSPATSTQIRRTVMAEHRNQPDEEPQDAETEEATSSPSFVESPSQSQFTNLQRQDESSTHETLYTTGPHSLEQQNDGDETSPTPTVDSRSFVPPPLVQQQQPSTLLPLVTASQSALPPPAQQVEETPPPLSPSVAAAQSPPPLEQQQQKEEEEEVLPPINMASHCTVLPIRKEEEETSHSSTSSPFESSESTAQHLVQINQEAEEASQSTTRVVPEKQQEMGPQLPLLPVEHDCATTLSLTQEEQVRQEENPSSASDSELPGQSSQELSPLADEPPPFTHPVVQENQAHQQQQQDDLPPPLPLVESLQATPSLAENEQTQQQKDESLYCPQSEIPALAATKEVVLSSSTRTTPSPDKQLQPQGQNEVPSPPKSAQHQPEKSHQEKEDLPFVLSGVQQRQSEEQNGEVILSQFQKLHQPQHHDVEVSSLPPNLAPQKTQHEPEQQKEHEEETSSLPPPKVSSQAGGRISPVADQSEQHQQQEEETSPSSPLSPFRTALEHQRLREGKEVPNPESIELLPTMLLKQERRAQQEGETSPSRHTGDPQNTAQSVETTAANNPGSTGAPRTKEDLLVDPSYNPQFKTRDGTLSPKRGFLSNMTAESPSAASPTKGSNPLRMRRYTPAHVSTHNDTGLAVVRSKLRRTGVSNMKQTSSEEKEEENETVSRSSSFDTSGDGNHATNESLEPDVQQDAELAQRIDAIIFDHKLPEQEIVNTIVRKLRVELSPGQETGKSSRVSLGKNATGSPPNETKQREVETPLKTSRPNKKNRGQPQSVRKASIKPLIAGPGSTDTMALQEMKSMGSILSSETSSADSTFIETRSSDYVEDDTEVAHSKENDDTGKEVEGDDADNLQNTEESTSDPEKARAERSARPIVGCSESGRREEANSPSVDYFSDSDSDDEFDELQAVAQAMGTYPPPPPPSIPKKSHRTPRSPSSPSQDKKRTCLPASSALSQQEVVKSTVRLPPLHRAATPPPPPPPPPGKKKKRNRHTRILPTSVNDTGAGRVKHPTIAPIEQTSKADDPDAQKDGAEKDGKFHAFWLHTDGEAIMSVVDFDMDPNSSGMTTDADEKKTDETPPDETTHNRGAPSEQMATRPSAQHAEQNARLSLPLVSIKPRTDPAKLGIDVLGETSNDGEVQTSSDAVVAAHVSSDFMSTPTQRKEETDCESGKHVEESLSLSCQPTDRSSINSRSPLKEQPMSPSSTPVVFQGTTMAEKVDIAISVAAKKFDAQVSHAGHSPGGTFSSCSENQNSGEASNGVPSSVNVSSPEQTPMASVYESLKETPRAKTRIDKILIVPKRHPSPFEAAISYRPHILSYILGFLGDPVMVSKTKELNKACYEYVDENEHELMQAAVRLGGMSMNTRPAFWLMVTLGKFGAPKRIVPSEAGLRRRDELVKLERIGRSGKWHSVIERDVHRAFGNLPPHKTGARLRTDSIVRALVTWGKSRTIKTGVRGTGDPPPVSRDPSTEYDSDDISLAPTDTVSDWGGVSPVGSFTNNSFSSDTEKDKHNSNPNADKKESRNKRTDNEMALSGNSLTEENKKILQNKLSFVLHALSAAHSDIGYCQGMDYVVAHLLRILQETVRWSAARGTLPKAILSAPKVAKLTPGMAEDVIADLFAEVDRSLVVEEACFRMMDTFFTCYNLGHFYYPELRCLKTCCLVFEKLIQIKLPTLADHFEHHELNVGLFALGWFQTLFLYLPSMPTATVCHMWDIWLVERSYKIFFRVGTAILFLSQPILLNHELEGMMSYLNTFPDATLLSPDILIACALQIKVTNGMLMELEQQVAKNGS